MYRTHFGIITYKLHVYSLKIIHIIHILSPMNSNNKFSTTSGLHSIYIMVFSTCVLRVVVDETIRQLVGGKDQRTVL